MHRDFFRGAVFHHGRVPENCALALMGRFPSLMGRLLTLMGRFLEFALMGCFPSRKFPGKQPIKKRGIKRFLKIICLWYFPLLKEQFWEGTLRPNIGHFSLAVCQDVHVSGLSEVLPLRSLMYFLVFPKAHCTAGESCQG